MMNWAYIAGFFDGEGTCGMIRAAATGVAKLRVQIYQSEKNNGRVVLGNIKEFLENSGVKVNKLSVVDRHNRNHSPQYVLAIANLDALRKFFEGVLPYLIVKKVLAQDCLRHLKMFPTLNHHKLAIREMNGTGNKPSLSDDDIIKIKILYALRLVKQVDLAKQFDASVSSVNDAIHGRRWKRLNPFIGDNQAYGIKPEAYF